MPKYEIIMTANFVSTIEADDDVEAEKIAVESWKNGVPDNFTFNSLNMMHTDRINDATD